MKTNHEILITSIQAPIQDFIINDLAGYLAERLKIRARFIGDRPWQDRQRGIDEGEIDIAWICGLPYVLRADRGRPDIELLAAPVMAGERYQGQPIYYSDVIVRAESRYRSFEDLKGAAWAFNEPGSQSGYNITRYFLASTNAPNPFFGEVVEAGSHERSIQLVLAGTIDAAAIDTTVLDLVRAQDERIGSHLRVLTTLGPSPIPPLVISRSLDPELRHRIRESILSMHLEQAGIKLLEKGNILRFQRVSDSDYNPIRDMAREAQRIKW
jgi:phosphonate transport system substrate-binding protein